MTTDEARRPQGDRIEALLSVGVIEAPKSVGQ
jgi:hypothetical protein